MSSPAVKPRLRPPALSFSPPALSTGGLLTGAIAAVLAAVCVVAQGGFDLDRTTTAEVGVVILAAVGAAAAIVLTSTRRAWGAGTLLALAALAAYTTLSVTWSVHPADSWLEANRLFAYVAAFAGGLAVARLAPRHATAVLAAVTLASVGISLYALLTKVLPAELARDEIFARLRSPYGYWNAVGMTAALGVPGLLWAGTRHTGSDVSRTLAFPALGLLLLTVLMSYSRGAIVAIVAGGALWFALIPLRLRGAVMLGVCAAAVAVVAAWAFAQDGLSSEGAALGVRQDAAGPFALALVLQTAVLAAAGWGAQRLAEARPLTERRRRQVGKGLIAAVAAAPVIALVVLASTGGLGSGWRSLTSADAPQPSNEPGRLAAAASFRPLYWREARDVWEDRPLAGVGAGGYATARHRYRTLARIRHAHGYVMQTLADLGLIGLALSLAALAAFLVAAIRALGLRRRDRGQAFTPERIALVGLGAVVVTFGVDSLIDWIWAIPGLAVIALVCAGFLAGRGPFGEPSLPRRSWRADPLRLVAGGAVALLALVSVWAMTQPSRAAGAQDASLDALAEGRLPEARDRALRAVELNPLSVDPLFNLASVEEATGRRRLALTALERAVRLQPANPEAWRQLADFRLEVLDQPRRGLEAAAAGLYLEPLSQRSRNQFVFARRRVARRELELAAAAAHRAAQAAAAERARRSRARARDRRG